MAEVRKIEPVVVALKPRKRVAAYARISMESDRLNHSLSAQVSYYSKLIQNNPEWIYAGVYADSGISGGGIRRRAEFKRMVEDCDAGKIDIVLCKSISRFARNTVDLLETVRHLKSLGIDVWFEKENIQSLSADGDVLRSDLIQCNDGVLADRPLDIWVLARRQSFGSRFFFSEIGDGGAVGCILS